jgi:ankyrin repeat protein
VFDSVKMTVDVQGGYTALHHASLNGHVSVVRLLVERSPQLFEMRTDVRGLSLYLSLCLSTDSWQRGGLATHRATLNDHVAVLKVLCEHAPATLEAKTDVSGVWGGG